VAAWVDDALADWLSSYLTQDAKIIERVTNYPGPISSFSARTDLAYLIGMLDKTIYDDLNIIRGIRNDFAHSRDITSFEGESIRDRCKRLQFQKLSDDAVAGTEENPYRRGYISSCVTYASYFLYAKMKQLRIAPCKFGIMDFARELMEFKVKTDSAK
jgi:hypothetical protein